uniref:Uncharacterized protein n=1 Tax=Rhinopithecus bieti TaxID=61621 RepID=A0A2K6L3S0_RHIBE
MPGALHSTPVTGKRPVAALLDPRRLRGSGVGALSARTQNKQKGLPQPPLTPLQAPLELGSQPGAPACPPAVAGWTGPPGHQEEDKLRGLRRAGAIFSIALRT